MPFLRPRLKRLNAGSSSDLLHALDARQRSGCKYSKKSLNKILQQHAEDKSADSCFKNDAYDAGSSARSTFLVAFSPDCSKVASTNGDHTVKIFDTSSGKLVQTLKGHPRTPWCLCFHPINHDILASGCLGGQVRIWDLRTGVSDVFAVLQGSVVASLAFHPTDNILAVATRNKLLLMRWDTRETVSKFETASAQETVRFVKFHPLGNSMLTAITNNPERPCETLTLEEIDSALVQVSV